MEKCLITGTTGFAGSHLIDYLLTLPDTEIHGLIRWRSRNEHISHFRDKIVLHECDIRDLSSLIKIIKSVQPNKIFHLAAQSYVVTSWHAPADTLTTNIIGCLNLLEAIREIGLNPRIQLACSSEEYGMTYSEEVPVKETNPLRPLSPYAVSKVGQDLLGYQYFKSYNMDIVRTRAFNHTGPRRGDVFVSSNFAKQIAMMEKGGIEPVLRVGNLEAIRDFTDVRDIVKGYHLALMKGESGEVYNISSGKGYVIREVLDILMNMTSISVKVAIDPERFRPSDIPVLIGDSTKFRSATGWAPTIPFERTLEDLLNYWRERV